MEQKIQCTADASNLIRKLSLVIDDVESFSYTKKKYELSIKRKNGEKKTFNTFDQFDDYLDNLQTLKNKNELK